MRFDRRTKARALAALSPMRMLIVLLSLGTLVMLWFVAAFVALIFDVTLPTTFVGGIFLATLPVSLFRFWMVGQGWGAVRVHELNLVSMAYPDLNQDPDKPAAIPAALQEALAETVHRKGWLAWSDVNELAKEHGIPANLDRWLMGGGTGPVARRKDWQKALDGHAWHSGRMAHALPKAASSDDLHTLPARSRF